MNNREYIVQFLTKEELDTFEVVELMTPVILNKPNSSCHTVTSELLEFTPELEQVNGTFGKIHEHSWLRFKNKPNIIIDPYPLVCLGGPILIETKYMLPWKDLYKEE